MTPFDRGVRAGLAAAARVADERGASRIAAENDDYGYGYGSACEVISRTIRSLDPATIKETGDGRIS